MVPKKEQHEEIPLEEVDDDGSYETAWEIIKKQREENEKSDNQANKAD